MLPLLLLFVVLPLVELALLIEIGSRFGTGVTVGVIVATGFIGAVLARRQGLHVVRRIQHELEAGRLPTDSLVDGGLILLAGGLLVTPGVLSDLFGFLCLVPLFRRGVKSALKKRFEKAVREGHTNVHFYTRATDARWHPGEPWGRRREEKVVHDLREQPEGPRDRAEREGAGRTPDDEDREPPRQIP